MIVDLGPAENKWTNLIYQVVHHQGNILLIQIRVIMGWDEALFADSHCLDKFSQDDLLNYLLQIGFKYKSSFN